MRVTLLNYRTNSTATNAFIVDTRKLTNALLGDPWLLVAETRYLYDGWRVIQERDSNNVPVVAYTRGTDLSGSLESAGGIGGLLARSHGYSSGNWSTHNYYHADGNGNVTFLLANDQTLSARYVYDPYGRLVGSSGSLAAANTYRFSSKEVHGRTGFTAYLYRWYAAEMQRWVNRDPIGEKDDFNLYRFARNNSANKVDRFGLACGSGITDTLIPDSFICFDFTTCCQNHDDCYSRPGASRENCDLSFLKCMNDTCGRFNVPCRVAASTYYVAVWLFGEAAFREAQSEHEGEMPLQTP